jgi:hypothetical protein
MAFNLQSVSTTRRAIAPKVVLYGPGKIGKTTMAASAPNPIGILTEDGSHCVDAMAFPIATSLNEVYEQFNVLLTEAHEYRTLFLDSLDWLEPLLHTYVCQKNNWKDIESPGYGKGYIEAAEEWRNVLAWLDALRNQKNMAIIVIAHEQVKRFENPTGESFDLYTLKLHKAATALVQEWADVIAFLNYRTFTKKEDAGFNKKETKAFGTGERVMYLEARPAFLAGNRYNLPAELPLSWQAFADAMAQSRV